MDALFACGFIGNLKLTNRIVMPVIKTGFAEKVNIVNERYLNFLEARARGGVGLIMAEAVSDHLLDYADPARDDLLNNAYARIVELVKRVQIAGGNIALHLNHVAEREHIFPGGKALAPDDMEGYVKKIIQGFVLIAETAANAGVDALEIQGVDRGLMDETAVQWEHFIKNLFTSLQQKVNLPLIYRLHKADQGVNRENALYVCRVVEQAGAAAIHISVDPFQTLETPGFLIPLGAAVKKAVKIPVIAAGRINRPELAAEILKHGAADFVAMGRALLADPELPLKAKEGCLEEIRPCIGCNEGCINRYLIGEPITCVQNLAVGREKELLEIHKSDQLKNILVVGGGPAGMTAAKYLQKRGHGVKLVERSSQLGGQVNIAALVPGKQDYRFITTCLQKDLCTAGLEVALNTSPTCMSGDEVPDVMIVASGSKSKKLPVLNGLTVPVLTARELISSKLSLPGGTVLVIGGGLLGLEAAYTLATRGNDVIVAEQEKDIARDGAPVYRKHLLEKIEGCAVEILTETAVQGSERAVVKLQNLRSGKTTEVHAVGGVVVAVGSEQDFPEDLQKQNDTMQVVIGDARLPGKILDAMEEALAVALQL